MGTIPLYELIDCKLIERIGVMVRDNYKKNQKRKGFVIVAFACFICLSALAIGATVLNKKDNKTEKDTSKFVDLNETTNKLEQETTENQETTVDMAVDGKVIKNTDAPGKNVEDSTDENNTIQIVVVIFCLSLKR